MDRLTIGKVAQLAGVGVDTIRFYERKGLLDSPPRSLSGYRQYSLETVAHIRFIRRAKELGFSLKEIKELLDLRMSPETTCEDIRQRARAKIRDIEGRLEALKRMKAVLEKLADSCQGKGPLHNCPILEALEERDEKTTPE